MAFGQAAGPPAQQRQIDELAALFERAGFSSFKEARHPYGLNHRQAGGRFTTDEAAELIERLHAAEAVKSSVEESPIEESPAPPDPAGAAPAGGSARRPRSAASKAAEHARAERRAQALSTLEDAQLVAELERRGWCCIPPVIEGE